MIKSKICAGDIVIPKFDFQIGQTEDGKVIQKYDLSLGVVHCTLIDPSNEVKDQRSKAKKGATRDTIVIGENPTVAFPLSLPCFEVGVYPYEHFQHPYKGPSAPYIMVQENNVYRSKQDSRVLVNIQLSESFLEDGLYTITHLTSGYTGPKTVKAKAKRLTLADIRHHLETLKHIFPADSVKMRVLSIVIKKLRLPDGDPKKVTMRDCIGSGILFHKNLTFEAYAVVRCGVSQFYIPIHLVRKYEED